MTTRILLVLFFFLPTFSYSRDGKKDNCDFLIRFPGGDKIMRCFGNDTDTLYEYRFNAGSRMPHSPIIISTFTMNKRNLFEFADSLNFFKNIPFDRKNRIKKLSFGLTVMNGRKTVGFITKDNEIVGFDKKYLDELLNIIYKENRP